MFFLHAYAELVGGIGEIRHKEGARCADGDCRRLTGDIYAELPQQPQTAAVGLDVAFLERPQRVERVFALGSALRYSRRGDGEKDRSQRTSFHHRESNA